MKNENETIAYFCVSFARKSGIHPPNFGLT